MMNEANEATRPKIDEGSSDVIVAVLVKMNITCMRTHTHHTHAQTHTLSHTHTWANSSSLSSLFLSVVANFLNPLTTAYLLCTLTNARTYQAHVLLLSLTYCLLSRCVN